MLDFSSYEISLLLAGFIYIVTPGPVFLAIINLVSTQGTKAGLQFVTGAVFGCMVWLTLTIGSLIEADRLPKIIFLILTLACASYLFYLGYKIIKSSINVGDASVFQKPFTDGLTLALLNPKSYPVMVSLFSAIAIQYSDHLSWPSFPKLFIFSVLGFMAGYLFMIICASIPPIKSFYNQQLRFFSIAFGLIFIGFGLSLLLSVSSF